MRSSFKAKTFQSRMGFKGRSGAVGERAKGGCGCGASAGEKAFGLSRMRKGLPSPKSSPYKQSSDGNGGK